MSRPSCASSRSSTGTSIPPDTIAEGTDIASAPWRTEYDVISTLRATRPRGAGARRPRRPRRHPPRRRRVEAAHRLQPARRRSTTSRSSTRTSSATSSCCKLPYTGCNPRGLLARARQVAVEEAARLSPHPGAGVRGRSASAGRSALPKRLRVPADREVADAGGVDRHLAGVGRRQRRASCRSASRSSTTASAPRPSSSSTSTAASSTSASSATRRCRRLPVWELFFTQHAGGRAGASRPSA